MNLIAAHKIFRTACDSEKRFVSLVALTKWKVKDLNKNLREGDQAQSISAERGKHPVSGLSPE